MFDKKLDEIQYTVFDTETTGYSPAKGARLVEIGAVRINTGLELDLSEPFNELINPMCEIPYSAYKVHGISNKMVENSPKVEEILPKFKDFLGQSVIIAHNARFDYTFVNYHTEEQGEACILNKVMDTVKLANFAFPGLDSYSLDNLIKHFEIDVPVPGQYRHRAVYDAAHTAILFIKCIKQIKKYGIFTMGELYAETIAPFVRWT